MALAALPPLICGARRLTWDAPCLMGVLNVTPDSFSDGGQLYRDGRLDPGRAEARARALWEAGAAIIDVGGESTRPGATPVSEAEELDRVLPVVERLVATVDAVVSVDTSSPAVMTEAARRGAGLINDVRALQQPGALAAAAATGLPVVLMHMQGEPDTMQANPVYDDPVTDVCRWLEARREAAVAAGIDRARLVLDPGFGFGKTLAHNLSLMRHLRRIVALGSPVLVGVSRKSMIGAVTGQPVTERLPGSLALAVMAVERGAAIVRVHDVAATRDALRLVTAVGGVESETP